MPPSGKRPRKWTSQGPPAAVGERYLTASLGWPLGRTWPTAKAFAFLCVDLTQISVTGQVHTMCPHTCALHSLLFTSSPDHNERRLWTCFTDELFSVLSRVLTCLLCPSATRAAIPKGKGEGRLGQGGRGRSKGGEKPTGPTAYGGKGSKGSAANGDLPVGAASCGREHKTMASCQTPPLFPSVGPFSPYRHALSHTSRITTPHGCTYMLF